MGFVIPHVGLIVLLVGCFLSRHYGVEATLAMFEGDSSDLAYKGTSQHVELDGQQHFNLQVIPATAESSSRRSWCPSRRGRSIGTDYQDGTLSAVPWLLAHRDRGVIYDHDGIRLEVRDYLSNSEIVNLASLAVEAVPLRPDGRESPDKARSLQFSVKIDAGPHSAEHRYGVGDEQTLAGGQRILFWMTGSAEETAAFRHSKPAGPLGKLGRVVLYAAGKSYDWSIDDWKSGTRRALGDSGLEAELVDVGEGEVDLGREAQFDARGSVENPSRFAVASAWSFRRSFPTSYRVRITTTRFLGPIGAAKARSPKKLRRPSPMHRRSPNRRPKRKRRRLNRPLNRRGSSSSWAPTGTFIFVRGRPARQRFRGRWRRRKAAGPSWPFAIRPQRSPSASASFSRSVRLPRFAIRQERQPLSAAGPRAA